MNNQRTSFKALLCFMITGAMFLSTLHACSEENWRIEPSSECNPWGKNDIALKELFAKNQLKKGQNQLIGCLLVSNENATGLRSSAMLTRLNRDGELSYWNGKAFESKKVPFENTGEDPLKVQFYALRIPLKNNFEVEPTSDNLNTQLSKDICPQFEVNSYQTCLLNDEKKREAPQCLLMIEFLISKGDQFPPQEKLSTLQNSRGRVVRTPSGNNTCAIFYTKRTRSEPPTNEIPPPEPQPEPPSEVVPPPRATARTSL